LQYVYVKHRGVDAASSWQGNETFWHLPLYILMQQWQFVQLIHGKPRLDPRTPGDTHGATASIKKSIITSQFLRKNGMLELHVWGPAFGLPSIDAHCLAAIAYLQQAVPRGKWQLIASSNPVQSPTSTRLVPGSHSAFLTNHSRRAPSTVQHWQRYLDRRTSEYLSLSSADICGRMGAWRRSVKARGCRLHSVWSSFTCNIQANILTIASPLTSNPTASHL
jgi:hypothetical protein